MPNLIVTANALNMRAEPDLTGEIITTLNRGDIVVSLDSSRNGYWQRVQSGVHVGWCSYKYLQPLTEDTQAAVKYPWLEIAIAEIGVSEVAGSGSNPRIVKYLQSTTLSGNMASSDETPWCSAFVNWCVEQAGYAGTDSAGARSWLKWGQGTDKPVAGCVVVFKRGAPPNGHVAFFVSMTSDSVRVLGGNQGNR